MEKSYSVGGVCVCVCVCVCVFCERKGEGIRCVIICQNCAFLNPCSGCKLCVLQSSLFKKQVFVQVLSTWLWEIRTILTMYVCMNISLFLYVCVFVCVWLSRDV